MDINDLRTLFTVISFFTFLGIVAWAYSGRRRAAFEEAANLPFSDPEELAQEHRARVLASW